MCEFFFTVSDLWRHCRKAPTRHAAIRERGENELHVAARQSGLFDSPVKGGSAVRPLRPVTASGMDPPETARSGTLWNRPLGRAGSDNPQTSGDAG